MSNTITRRRRTELITGAIVLAVLAVLPLPIRDVYTQNLMILTILYAGLSQAWNILGGYCGQISLGHALYFGIGAYVSTLLYVNAGIPPTIGMFAAGAVGAVAALLVGWPCFRLSGHYYAIATVVVGEIGYLLFLNWDFVGAATGVYVPFHGESWAALQFRTSPSCRSTTSCSPSPPITWAIVAWFIEGSRWGYSWRAVRDDVVAARSLAVRIFPSKMAAAAISGFFTAMGGAIYAQYVGYIDPDSVLAASFSILIALPAVLGGVGTLWGPLIGAIVLIPTSELTRSYLGGAGGVDLMIYGGLIVAISLARPAGLVSLLGLRTNGGARCPRCLRSPRFLKSIMSASPSAASRPMWTSASPSHAGELLGLIGPNGAGKTSLFNAISGEVAPDRGEIRLDGQRISGVGPLACARAGIARTFQVVRSFDSMTVLENVMVGAFSRTSRAPRRHGRGRARARHHGARRDRADASLPTPSPRRRSAGWRSPARWPPGPASCCWTRC